MPTWTPGTRIPLCSSGISKDPVNDCVSPGLDEAYTLALVDSYCIHQGSSDHADFHTLHLLIFCQAEKVSQWVRYCIADEGSRVQGKSLSSERHLWCTNESDTCVDWGIFELYIHLMGRDWCSWCCQGVTLMAAAVRRRQ